MTPVRPRYPGLRTFTLAGLLGACGCATTAQLRDQPLTAGSVQAFPRKFAEVRDAGCEAIRSYGWKIREVGTPDDTTWWALASKGSDMGMTTMGTVARLVVFDSRSDTTVVLVRSEEALATTLNDRNEWAPKFFYRMSEIMTGQRAISQTPCAVAAKPD